MDFGLAQSYDKISENIFNYEKGSNKKSAALQNENNPARKNLISISSRKSVGGHLVLTTPKTNQTPINETNKMDPNSLPHSSHQFKEKHQFQISNSQSFECNLSRMQATPNKSSSPSKNLTISNTNSNVVTNTTNTMHNNVNSPKPSTPNFQKYYSFQKPSYSLNDCKCTCFNMQFVCETCTSRYFYFYFLEIDYKLPSGNIIAMILSTQNPYEFIFCFKIFI